MQNISFEIFFLADEKLPWNVTRFSPFLAREQIFLEKNNFFLDIFQTFTFSFDQVALLDWDAFRLFLNTMQNFRVQKYFLILWRALENNKILPNFGLRTVILNKSILIYIGV